MYQYSYTGDHKCIWVLSSHYVEVSTSRKNTVLLMYSIVFVQSSFKLLYTLEAFKRKRGMRRRRQRRNTVLAVHVHRRRGIVRATRTRLLKCGLLHAVQLVRKRCHRRHVSQRVERVHLLRVERHRQAARLRVNRERRLEQVINTCV